MAAIAAGLWEPNAKCLGWGPDPYDPRSALQPCSHGRTRWHKLAAPDMHLPENLWRALENRRVPGWGYQIGAHASCEPFCRLSLSYEARARESNPLSLSVSEQADTLTDAVFAALVALYKAEHPAAEDML